jgi:hypothetical protein
METRSRRARSDHRAALPQLPYHNGGSPEAPVDPGSERVDQISGYVGTVLFFEAHGFSRVCQTAGRRGGKPRWLVRRELP